MLPIVTIDYAGRGENLKARGAPVSQAAVVSGIGPAAGPRARLRIGLEIIDGRSRYKDRRYPKKHMKEPRDDISLSTALTDLKIESLDLAMIVFDIEDTFGVEIPYNANEDVQDFKTVGSVVEKVKGLMAAGPSAASA